MGPNIILFCVKEYIFLSEPNYFGNLWKCRTLIEEQLIYGETVKSIQQRGNWTKDKTIFSSSSQVTKRKPCICIVSYLISISSYSLLYSGIVAFLREENSIWRKQYEISVFGNLKLASQANSKHIFTGQKNSALVSLQFSKLATATKELKSCVFRFHLNFSFQGFLLWEFSFMHDINFLSPMNAGLASALKSSIFFSGSVIVSHLGNVEIGSKSNCFNISSCWHNINTDLFRKSLIQLISDIWYPADLISDIWNLISSWSEEDFDLSFLKF